MITTIHRLVLMVFCVFCITACQVADKADSQQLVERAYEQGLRDTYAAFRKQQILDVNYQLSIELDAERDVFNGRVTLNFELAKNNRAPVTIDFFSGEIRQLIVNGQPIKADYQQWFITLAPELLKPGSNEVSIDYQAKYSTLGEGLHRYQDKQTGRVYLYTNFEPFSANKFFPHFDQPNLKAHYTLAVTAPAHWQVISATRETAVTETNGKKLWQFPQTAKIPSYIFPLHAGDYVSWEDNSGPVPLRLFARQELAEYVVPSEWFNYTHKSFEFFNDYFDYPYPFGKYDQIIVPEFNWGAMENLAAVTFAERFITRGTRTEAEQIALASVIAHEMAHMWFGNLATMDWWNGLWLNESFATYMAYLALARTEQVDGTWDSFYSRIKQWAYATDQQVTTHAIELPVSTTSEAFSNFDGITYGKGASLLKQLPYYLGQENFRQGVAKYLKKFAYRNTTLGDFIGELGKAAGKDLTGWTQAWLFETGLNTLQAEFRCTADAQQLAHLSLKQTAPADYPTLREQRVQLGLFTVANTTQPAKLIAKIPVTYSDAETTVVFPAETPCPDLVYPNLDDWGYVKVILDEKSQQTLKAHLPQFTDATLRLMLWETFWDAVLDAHLPLTEHADFVLAQLSAETNPKIIDRVSTTLVNAYGYFTALANAKTDYGQERRNIEQFFWQEARARATQQASQRVFFQRFIATSHTTAALDALRGLIIGEQTLRGLNLDQDLRWQILIRLNQFTHRDYLALTQVETQKDSSQRGIQSALAAEAARPNAAIKQVWLERIFIQDPNYSLDQQRTVMQNFLPVEQNLLRKTFSEQIIDRSLALPANTDDQIMKTIGNYLVPNTCTRASAEQLAAAKDELNQQRPILEKSYRIAHQENLRCLAIGEVLEEDNRKF